MRRFLKKTTILFATMALGGFFSSFDYSKEWKNVDSESQINPQTALSKIDAIEKKAKSEKNWPQLLKCFLMRNNVSIRYTDTDEFTLIKELQKFGNETKDKEAKAMSLYLESLYYQFYFMSEWTKISKRTELHGEIPEDMSEWTANIFIQKIHDLRLKALEEKELVSKNCSDYKAILTNDYLSNNDLRPTLFDLIAYECIEDAKIYEYECFNDQEVKKIAADLVNIHKDDQDKTAFVEARINELKIICTNSINGHSSLDSKRYEKEMAKLVEETDAYPASILARIEYATLLKENHEIWDKNSDVTPQQILAVCNDGLSKHKHNRAIYLSQIAKSLEMRYAYIDVENPTIRQGENIRLKLTYANLDNITISLAKFMATPEQFAKGRFAKGRWERQLLETKEMGKYSFNLEKSNYCVRRDTTLEIPALQYGAYRITIVDNKNEYNNHSTEFIVSDLAAIYSQKEDTHHFFILDNKSGKPMKDVFVNNPYRLDKDKSKTDKDGYSNIDGRFSEQLHCFFVNGDDSFLNRVIWSSRSRSSNNKSSLKVSIFTDRAIYRPGQTVHFKCIAYQISQESTKVLENKSLTISLKDANRQKVGEMKLTTNSFGSASGSFVLPANALSGTYHFTGDVNYSIKVEEYKRPSFELSLKRPTEAVSFGNTVNVKGTANYLLGTPLSNAKVEYTVMRTSHPYFWWWHSFAPDKVVDKGELTTGNDGTYTIHFVPEKEGAKDAIECYRYKVNAKVTDANGETHEEEITVAVGDESLAIVCPNIERMEINDLSKQKFSVVNLNCEGQEKKVKYTISCNDKEVFTGEATSDKEKGFSIDAPTKKWPSGIYKILLSTKDERNREVTNSFSTIIYRSTDKVPPVVTDFWFEDCAKKELTKEEYATVRVGSSLSDANLLVIIYNEHDLQSYEWIHLNNQIQSFEYDLKDCESKEIQFFLLHNGVLHRQQVTLKRKEESKELPMKLSVFRDKMEPGSKEKWTIQLPSNKAAEVLATMYDASLDQIKANNWYFRPSYEKHISFPYWQQCLPETFYLSLENEMSIPHIIRLFNCVIPIEVFRPQMFDMVPLELGTTASYSITAGYSETKSDLTGAVAQTSQRMAAPKRKSNAMYNDMIFSRSNNKNDESLEIEPVKIRSNFAETAFFFPDLTTDKEGNINLSFTMPESLTRWKFMALGHTADLYTGQLVQNVVTQKSFMISPNYPRFLRHGDKCVFSAKVINLSEVAQSGSAQLQLLDPITEKVVIEKSCDFSLQAGDNSAVKWEFDVPRDADALLVRVIGRTENFSDAEQKLLPLLSDRVVLTQSLPMAVRGGQTKEFTLNNLKNNQSTTLNNKFLKLEMATNPVWYAIQALPTVATVQHDNAIDFSAALFATRMAEHIAQSNPKIFKVIELWKQQSKDKETLLSNLEKNTEVKNVLLNETPWVMDAQNETERKQRLSMLFDINDIRSKCDTWQKKLDDLQNGDGGFSWFKGMLSNRYTTLFVVDNYCRLRKAGIDVSDQKESMKKAVQYLDQCLKKNLEEGLRYNKKYKEEAHIWPAQIYYYQLRGQLTEFALDKDCQEAFDFYFKLLVKEWDKFGLQSKALAAMALKLYQKDAEAHKVIKSIREFSQTNEEMGMYWPKNVSGYFWEDAAISTHTRLTEALAMVDNQQSEQDELRIWLLNQKRTQNWESTIATIDAIYVLLLNGSDWISKDNVVSIKMGGNEMKPESTEVGTGYYAITVPGKEVTSNMGVVELKSEAGGNLSWGALYWQFEEDMEKVLKNKTGLHIEKMVMLETTEGSKVVLKTLNEENKLKVGDKLVVRLTLRTDRDLDYVSLKDQRAACLEPTLQLSGYRCSEHTCYYQSAKDAAMYYFFDHLAKGTYVFEYPLYVTNSGSYNNGITTVQCLYAPEFTSNTGSVRIKVEK